MDPADSASLREELVAQAGTLQRHDLQLVSIIEGLQQMAVRHDRAMQSIQEHLGRLRVPEPSPAPTPDPALASGSPVRSPPASDARLPPPERYAGIPGSCRPFLVQCSLAFELQPSAFPTERSRVAYIVSLLIDRARAWGTAEWERQSASCASVESFSAELRKLEGLFDLRQEGRSVADYSIEFRTVAAESSWNASSLLDAFYHGLSNRIKDELAARDLPADIDALNPFFWTQILNLAAASMMDESSGARNNESLAGKKKARPNSDMDP
ncbi:Retrotransposon-derived protein PEG10 [Merluccius polli]|uniref:Retrotransposon-derived protein PEG10 n=1 Tax=Merluccius polli TaxID=89951 RepID=A0AA47M743_MERPO|nr:Retrotransposon-derived protein PEG10 [Merluccius polli]